MQFSTNSTQVAAYLEPRDISSLADHSHSNNPAAIAIIAIFTARHWELYKQY